MRTPRLPEIPAERPFQLPPRYIRYIEELESQAPQEAE
jgi:hypothetical protein